MIQTIIIINVHLDNFRNLSGNKIWSRLNPTLQRYPNTIPMLKFSVELMWCGPGGEKGDLINPFGSPKWCPENPCGSSQSLVGWEVVVAFWYVKYFNETKYFFCIFLLYALHTEYLKNEELQYITILSYEWYDQFYIFF